MTALWIMFYLPWHIKYYCERSNALLRRLNKDVVKSERYVRIDKPEYIALTYSNAPQGVERPAFFLADQGYLKAATTQEWEITGKGYVHGDEITSQSGPGVQGFVAM